MEAPFLSYLTLFQSRLGSLNLLLPLTSYGYTAKTSLAKKVARVLTGRSEVDLKVERHLLEYLVSKKFLGSKSKKNGRYPGYSVKSREGSLILIDSEGHETGKLIAFQIDCWMSDPSLRSTVGVPTPDNVQEIIDLAATCRVLTNNKNSWTAAGHASSEIRKVWPSGADNPMLIGPEIIILLRQLLECDGFMLEALVQRLSNRATVRRDDVARELPAIAVEALEMARRRKLQSAALRQGQEFITLVTRTEKRRDDMTGAPGVLEHRITPRLEWLTDLGVLSKAHDARNGFSYAVTPDADKFLAAIRSPTSSNWARDDAAVSYWHSADAFAACRRSVASYTPMDAVRVGYRMMRRPVGPASIREVSLLASMLSQDPSNTTKIVETRIIEWAKTNRAVKLSGGRFGRGPEMMYVPDSALEMNDG